VKTPELPDWLLDAAEDRGRGHPRRDRKRIAKILAALAAYWYANPDLRLCQLVGDIGMMVGHRDPYYVEDEAFLARLRWELDESNPQA
jgi:hypothetical protein